MNRFRTCFLYVFVFLSIAIPACAGEITVIDSLGRSVAVPASPERIIGSGSGALRLIVYLAGVLLMDLALIFFGWDWQMFTVNLLLGIPVFFEATGLYHAVVKELADAKKED